MVQRPQETCFGFELTTPTKNIIPILKTYVNQCHIETGGEGNFALYLDLSPYNSAAFIIYL